MSHCRRCVFAWESQVLENEDSQGNREERYASCETGEPVPPVAPNGPTLQPTGMRLNAQGVNRGRNLGECWMALQVLLRSQVNGVINLGLTRGLTRNLASGCP